MSALYTPQMLALSAQLARYPFSDALTHQAQARSPVCGSAIELGLDLDDAGGVSRVGMKVSACAIGQSSAAIMAGAIAGRSAADVAETLERIRGWLAGEGGLPSWPNFEAIEGALPHPGRHGALLLPWEAAFKALSATP